MSGAILLTMNRLETAARFVASERGAAAPEKSGSSD